MKYAAMFLALLLVGCAGRVEITTEIQGPNDWGWTQTVKGKADAAVEASKQMFDGKLAIDPTTKNITIELKSGQNATNIQTQESELLREVLSDVLLKALSAK